MSFKLFFFRYLAYTIDCIIAFGFVMLLFQWALLSNIREYLGINDSWFQDPWNMEFYVLTTISLPVYLYFAYLDSKAGRGTLGKRLMHLKVVSSKDEQRLNLGTSLIRAVLKLLPWELIHIGIIFPTPLYYQENGKIRILTYIGIGLFVIYVFGAIFHSKKQTLYDLILQTKVNKDTV